MKTIDILLLSEKAKLRTSVIIAKFIYLTIIDVIGVAILISSDTVPDFDNKILAYNALALGVLALILAIIKIYQKLSIFEIIEDEFLIALWAPIAVALASAVLILNN